MDNKIYYEMPPPKKGYHRHHIVPKHMGGTDADGIVYLTKEEHAEAHWRLYCEHELEADLGAMNIIMEQYIFPIDKSGEKNPMYGKKHTPEAIKKVSEASIRHWKAGKYDSRDYTGDNNPRWGINNNTPEEILRRKKELSIQVSGKNNVMAKPEVRRKHAESVLNENRNQTGENNPFYGKKHSEETKDKFWRGEKNAMYGKKHTPETLKKMSEASLKAWAKRKAK